MKRSRLVICTLCYVLLSPIGLLAQQNTENASKVVDAKPSTGEIAEASGLADLERDRPQILEIIQKGDAVWTWLNTRFGSTNYLPVLWSKNDPKGPSHYLSQHSYDKGGRAIIIVRHLGFDGKPLGSEQLLASVVYELINATHRDAFRELAVEAENRTLSRDQFIEAMAKLEFESKMEIQQFAVDVWIPYAVSKHLPFQDDCWSKGVPHDFDRWLYVCRLSKDGYPDDIYGPYYDKVSRIEGNEK